MNKYEKDIGKNIREVRLASRMSQEKLAGNCGFSNTTLSAYENGKKIPSLATISKIAKELNVSIERLYYGDENNAFINSEVDIGKKVVNSIYFLWESGVISYFENYEQRYNYEYDERVKPRGIYLYLRKYDAPIKRFLKELDEFQNKRETYTEPEAFF